MISSSVIRFAPGSDGTFSGGEDGDGCYDPSPSLSLGLRRLAPRKTSCSIGEPLALGASNSASGAFQIVDSECDPVVVSEIELGSVAMQVRLADVEIAAVHATLNDREEILDRIGMPECGADVLLGAMVHRAVASELSTGRPVNWGVIGHQVAGL